VNRSSSPDSDSVRYMSVTTAAQRRLLPDDACSLTFGERRWTLVYVDV